MTPMKAIRAKCLERQAIPCIGDRCLWAFGNDCAVGLLAFSFNSLDEGGMTVWPEPEEGDEE